MNDALIRKLQETKLCEEDLFPEASPEEIKQREIEAEKRIAEETRVVREKWESFKPGDRVKLNFPTSMFHTSTGTVTRKKKITNSIYGVFVDFPRLGGMKYPIGYCTNSIPLEPGESGCFDVEDLEKVPEETSEDVEIEGLEEK